MLCSPSTHTHFFWECKKLLLSLIDPCFFCNQIILTDRKENMKILSYALLVLLLVSHSRRTSSQEVEDERDFNYVDGSGKGPENWGDIHEEWRECKNGEMQSPIDLLHERVEVVGHLGRLKRSYRPSNTTLKNRGHDIMLKWVDDAGSINVNGTDYKLKQCHWHSPSEHTINGRSYDLEAHMVHQSSDNKTAVVGIMYTIGRPDTFLLELMGLIKSIADTHEREIVAGVIDPRHLKMGSRKYYRYLGSLTTPPCTEGVIWTMVKKVRTVSREQVRILRQAVDDKAEENARPTQAVNEREVLLYNPRISHESLHPQTP